MYYLIKYYFLLILFLFIIIEKSQSQVQPTYGLFGNYNLNFHYVDFRSFPGVPLNLPLNQEGTGDGFIVGLHFDHPLYNRLHLAIRADYSTRNGTMKYFDNVKLSGNLRGIYEHRVTANLADIGLEAHAQYSPFGSLWFYFGARISAVTTKNYSQIQNLVSPQNVVFPSGSTTRNEVNNQPIPTGSPIYESVIAGISYDVPLDSKKSYIVAPEVYYSYGVTPVGYQLQWDVNSIRFGFAIKYCSPLREFHQRFEDKNIIDTIYKESKIVVGSIIIGKQNFTSTSREMGDEIIITETRYRTDTLLISTNRLDKLPYKELKTQSYSNINSIVSNIDSKIRKIDSNIKLYQQRDSIIRQVDYVPVKQPRRPITLFGRLKDEKDTPIIGRIVINETNESGTSTEIITDKSGKYALSIQEGKKYFLKVTAKDYVTTIEEVDLTSYKSSDSIEKDVLLNSIKLAVEKGLTFNLKNILFETGKMELIAGSQPEIENLRQFMSDNESVRLEIGAHTDAVGSEQSNVILSDKRAKIVVDILLTSINKKRLIAIGYGESKPIATNDTEEGKAMNRRVEFKLIK